MGYKPAILIVRVKKNHTTHKHPNCYSLNGKGDGRKPTEKGLGRKCAINPNQLLPHERKISGSVREEYKVELFSKTGKIYNHKDFILYLESQVELITSLSQGEMQINDF